MARLRGQVQVLVLDDQEGADQHDLLLDQEDSDRHQRVVVDQKKTRVVEEKPIVSVGQAHGERGLQVLCPVVGLVEGVAHPGLGVAEVLHPQPSQLIGSCPKLIKNNNL